MVTQAAHEILDTKIVGDGPEGRAEWRYEILDPENDMTPAWNPYYIDENGRPELATFMPLPGSQVLFLECPIFECLYEGTRGPGKTLLLLMDFAKEVGKGYGKAWRGILFRKSFGDLDDVVRKIEEWFPLIFGKDNFRFLKSKSEYMCIWPDGEALLLRHMRNADDYDEYHGHEYPWIGWEELTQWEDDLAFNLMMSCCRPPRPGIPCRIRATTNPYGPGHNWVKKRYKLPDFRGKVIRIPGQMPRVAIHGALKENFILLTGAPEYETQIRNAARNPAQAEAWLYGDWNVTAGGMFDDLWNPKIHILPSFEIEQVPRSWTITRAYDHGQSKPFALGWWLESSGEPITVQGRLIGRLRGDLILFAEWYGTTGEDNTGLIMSSSDIGEGIRDREQDMRMHNRVIPGPADHEIWNNKPDNRGRAPVDDMNDKGIYFERADKSSGSRKRGWEVIRQFLKGAIPKQDGMREEPGMFICDRCRWWIELVPVLSRNEKDMDEISDNLEDHHADQTRYRSTWQVPGMWRRGF